MTTLFHDRELFIKDRPTKITEEQERQFYLDEAENFRKWGWSESDTKTIADDLRKLATYWRSSGGFELAKQLESDGSGSYEFGGDLVDYLDSLDSGKRYILDENVKAWVKAHDIKPKYSIGQALQIQSNIDRDYTSGMTVFITALYETTAHYIIHTDRNHNGGRYVTFEKLESSALPVEIEHL